MLFALLDEPAEFAIGEFPTGTISDSFIPTDVSEQRAGAVFAVGRLNNHR